MMRKYRNFIPPRKIIASIKSPTHMVTDIFGSKMMRTQMAPPAASTGSIPLNVLIASICSDIYAAAKMTKPYLAISDGCIVKLPKPIQRVAP